MRLLQMMLWSRRRLQVVTVLAGFAVVVMLLPTKPITPPGGVSLGGPEVGQPLLLDPPSATVTPEVLDPAQVPASPDPGMAGWADTAQAAQAATEFTAAWLRGRRTPTDEWLADLEPLTTPSLLQSLSYTEPGRIPDGTITGPGRVTVAGPITTVLVPTSDGDVAVSMVPGFDSAWVASGLTDA